MTDKAKSVEALRKEYLAIRKRSVAPNAKAFDAQVAVRVQQCGLESSPEVIVEQAKLASFTCPTCAGSGSFRTGGPCFRCNSKGVQNDADTRRNFGYAKFRASGKAPSDWDRGYGTPSTPSK